MTTSRSLIAAVCLLVTATTCADEEDPAKRAADLRKELKEEREELLAKLDRQEQVVNYVRRWLISEPQSQLRQVRQDARTSTPYIARLNQRKKVVLDKILAFPWESRGSLASGRALNALLDACGETAAQRCEKAEFLREQNEIPKTAVLPESIATEAAEQQRIQSMLRISEELVRHIQFTRGLAGSKVTGRLNQDVLTLEWPLVLRDPLYKPYRDEILSIREKAMNELEKGHGVEFSTAVDLKQSVDRLYTQVRRDEGRLVRQKVDPSVWIKYRRALSHIDRMRHTVLRFSEAMRTDDVQVPRFEGNTVEELIGYMHVNAMRFAEAGPNDQDSYSRVFRLMSRYYIEMQFQRTVIGRAEKDLERLASMDDMQELAERVLFNREYDQPLTFGEIRSSIPRGERPKSLVESFVKTIESLP